MKQHQGTAKDNALGHEQEACSYPPQFDCARIKHHWARQRWTSTHMFPHPAKCFYDIDCSPVTRDGIEDQILVDHQVITNFICGH
jgi:hypothetical protein